MSRRPLRVGFDVTSAVRRRPGGIAVYQRALLGALPEAAPEVEPVLFIRDGRWFRRRLVAGILPGARRRWLLGELRAPGADLDRFHGLGVRLPGRCRAPRSFTLHDLRGLDAVEHTDPSWVRTRSARLRETVARAEGILLLTEHARGRLQHHFPAFPMERTAVVPHGVDHGRFRPAAEKDRAGVRLRHGLERPFLLQAGALAPHKNPEGTLKAFALSQAAAAGWLLAFAGGGEDRYVQELRALAGRLGVDGRVRWLGWTAAADLAPLYSAAEAVLLPSHYEGFGLPVLEAMACGAAGIVSDGTCLPEVAGPAWPAVDPRDPEAMARTLDRLLTDAGRLEAARKAARQRAAGFTWERCARRTADFLASVLQPAAAVR